MLTEARPGIDIADGNGIAAAEDQAAGGVLGDRLRSRRNRIDGRVVRGIDRDGDRAHVSPRARPH